MERNKEITLLESFYWVLAIILVCVIVVGIFAYAIPYLHSQEKENNTIILPQSDNGFDTAKTFSITFKPQNDANCIKNVVIEEWFTNENQYNKIIDLIENTEYCKTEIVKNENNYDRVEICKKYYPSFKFLVSNKPMFTEDGFLIREANFVNVFDNNIYTPKWYKFFIMKDNKKVYIADNREVTTTNTDVMFDCGKDVNIANTSPTIEIVKTYTMEYKTFDAFVPESIKQKMYEQYLRDYPNETAFCLDYQIDVNDNIQLLNFTPIKILWQDVNKVTTEICDKNQIKGHSHTHIIDGNNICNPSRMDYVIEEPFGVIVCGNEKPTQIKFYKSMVENA